MKAEARTPLRQKILRSGRGSYDVESRAYVAVLVGDDLYEIGRPTDIVDVNHASQDYVVLSDLPDHRDAKEVRIYRTVTCLCSGMTEFYMVGATTRPGARKYIDTAIKCSVGKLDTDVAAQTGE